MISENNLATHLIAGVNSGEASVSPAVTTARQKADVSDIYPARAGEVHSAQINLTPKSTEAANVLRASAASRASIPVIADVRIQPLPVANGNVRSHPSRASGILPEVLPAGRQQRADPRNIIQYACDVLIEEIMALCGHDLPDPRKFRKYLQTLSLSDLSARRQELAKHFLSAPAEALPVEQIEANSCGSKLLVRATNRRQREPMQLLMGKLLPEPKVKP